MMDGQAGRASGVDWRWVFALLYLVGMIGFPWWYMSMPNGFYFAAYSIRRDVTAEQRALLAALGDTVIARRREYVGSIGRDNWMVWTKRSEFTSIDARDDGSIRLVLTMPTFTRIRGERVYTMVQTPLFMDRVTEAMEFSEPGFSAESTGYFQPVRFEAPQAEWVQRAVWDSLLWSAKQWDPNTSALTLTLSLVRRLQGVVEGARGNPSKIRGGYARMFYLSATTITTVGFGDVVPVTPLARAAVAFEAIYGVVVAGLFVNATMSRSARSQRGK